MKLLMATNNSGKVRELLELLDMPGVTAETLPEAGYKIEVVEDGTTFPRTLLKRRWRPTR